MGKSELIIVPEYNYTIIKHCYFIRFWVGGTIWREQRCPDLQAMPHMGISRFTRSWPIIQACNSFFGQFSYMTEMYDPNDLTYIIIRLASKVKGLSKFCVDKRVKWEPDFDERKIKYPEYKKGFQYMAIDYEKSCYEIEYMEIREEIVSFLEQTLGADDPDVILIKVFFENLREGLSLNEYVLQKSKYLNELDLDTWLEGIKEEDKLDEGRRLHA